MNWRVVWAIAQKDIVDAVKNRYILFGLVLPILLSLLLGLAFPISDDGSIITVAVYDPAGSRLVTSLRDMAQVKLLEVASEEQLVEAVKKEAVGGLSLPAGFDAAVEAGEQPELHVYLNHRRGGGGVSFFNNLIKEQLWAMLGQRFPARIVTTDLNTPLGTQSQQGLRFDLYILIILVVMALSMAGVFVVPFLLVEEKEKHTLQALLVSPARPAEVAAGKAVTGMVYSLLIAAILVALNRGWEGNWPVTALFVFVGALFIVMVGLLAGSLFRTTMQVNTWSSIIMLLLMLPSWISVMTLPEPLEIAFRLIPSHYLVEAMGLSMAGEASLARVWVDLAVLLGSTAVVFGLVVWMLRREERGES